MYVLCKYVKLCASPAHVYYYGRYQANCDIFVTLQLKLPLYRRLLSVKVTLNISFALYIYIYIYILYIYIYLLHFYVCEFSPPWDNGYSLCVGKDSYVILAYKLQVFFPHFWKILLCVFVGICSITFCV